MQECVLTAAELNQLITSLTSLIAAIGSIAALIFGYINHNRLQAVSDKNIADNVVATQKIQGISDQVEQVHVATNSMKDQLVVATAAASRAEGIAVGRGQADIGTPSDMTIALQKSKAEGVVIGKTEGMGLATPAMKAGAPKPPGAA
jgi:hypothetical protein